MCALDITADTDSFAYKFFGKEFTNMVFLTKFFIFASLFFYIKAEVPVFTWSNNGYNHMIFKPSINIQHGKHKFY